MIFATKELFDATVKRLEAAKAAKTWAMPKTDAGKTFSLIRHISTLIRLPTNIKQGIEHESPEFMPMEIYIQGNWPQDDEEAEEPSPSPIWLYRDRVWSSQRRSNLSITSSRQKKFVTASQNRSQSIRSKR